MIFLINSKPEIMLTILTSKWIKRSGNGESNSSHAGKTLGTQ